MTPNPAVSAKEKAREIIKTAIRHGCADELNGNPCGDILVKGCAAAEYVHPEDAAEMFVECIADEVLAALSATEGEAEPVAWGSESALKMIAAGVHATIHPYAPPLDPVPLYRRPPSAPAGVKVKPLEWKEYETEGEIDRWDTETALGTFYEIITEFDGYHVAHDYTHWAVKFETPDEAKAAAQTDYEQRIRSSLQPDTQAAAASALAGDFQELASASVRPEPSSAEPVMWQVRMRPTWDTASPWSPWRECTKECAERIASRATSGDWESEARALAPTAITDPPQALEDSKATLADANSIASAPAQEGRS